MSAYGLTRRVDQIVDQPPAVIDPDEDDGPDLVAERLDRGEGAIGVGRCPREIVEATRRASRPGVEVIRRSGGTGSPGGGVVQPAVRRSDLAPVGHRLVVGSGHAAPASLVMVSWSGSASSARSRVTAQCRDASTAPVVVPSTPATSRAVSPARRSETTWRYSVISVSSVAVSARSSSPATASSPGERPPAISSPGGVERDRRAVGPDGGDHDVAGHGEPPGATEPERKRRTAAKAGANVWAVASAAASRSWRRWRR